MKIFKLNKTLCVVCQSESTRSGFRHLATLVADNCREIAKVKMCYLNRTWERFEFESVLKKLLRDVDVITERQKENFFKKLN